MDFIIGGVEVNQKLVILGMIIRVGLLEMIVKKKKKLGGVTPNMGHPYLTAFKLSLPDYGRGLK